MSKVFVVVDEVTFKFLGVFPSMDLASAASVSFMDRNSDQSVLIIPIQMYEGSLKNKLVTVEEILNGKNEQ